MKNSFNRLVLSYDYEKISKHVSVLGWQNDGDIRGIQSVWHSLERDSANFEFFLPYGSDLKDLEFTLNRFVDTLAGFYSKDRETVIHELLGVSVDKLNIRLVSDKTQDGKIPLEEGINLIESSRELLLASFLSTYRPKKNFPGQRPDFVSDFLKKVDLGQTEEGSFIINLYVPNNLETDDNLNLGVQESFSRRSVQLISSAVEAINETVPIFLLSDDLTVFDKLVERGVSANLCSALVKMSSDGESKVEISINENNGIHREEIRKTSIIETGLIPVLKTVAEYFKREIESPETKIIGHVAVLHQEKDEKEGDITLSTVFGNGYKRVRITLGEEHYSRAIQAHQERLPLACTGTLIQQERRTLMTNVIRVDVIADIE